MSPGADGIASSRMASGSDGIFPSRSGVYRLGSLLDGELREKKDRVLKGLSAFAQADTDEADEVIQASRKALALVTER